MGNASRAKSLATKLFGFLAVLGLVVLGLFSYYVWLVMSDNLGTFHNTTDLADLDGDGDLDVILHNVRTESEFTAFGGAGLWINQGDGQFVHTRLEEGGGWASAAGDVDRDGDVDLAILTGWPLRWILNQGGAQGGQAGEFRVNNVVGAPERHNQFGSVLLGDLNNDGQVDGVVVGCCGRIWTLDPDDDTPNISWRWINEWDSTGGLAPPYNTSILSALDGLAMRSAALGDLDGDGDLDALIAGRRQAAMWWNDGQAAFTRSSQRFRYSKRHGLAIGDFNGDGRPDIFAAAYSSGYRVWFNQGDGTFRTAAWPMGV
jgi:hypothetical protein